MVVTEETTDIQYGCDCDCDNHPNSAAKTPVWILVERNGKQLRLCTRCDLSTDKKLARLASKAMPIEPFIEFHAFGALCLLLLFKKMPVEAEYLAQVSRGVH